MRVKHSTRRGRGRTSTSGATRDPSTPTCATRSTPATPTRTGVRGKSKKSAPERIRRERDVGSYNNNIITPMPNALLWRLPSTRGRRSEVRSLSPVIRSQRGCFRYTFDPSCYNRL